MKKLLFTDSTPNDLGILRATVFGIWFIIIVFSPFKYFAALPTELFEPLGIHRLIFFDTGNLISQLLLSELFLVILRYTLLLGCFLCMIGIKPYRWIAIPTVFLLFLADGITKGFNGFVNHAEFGVLYGSLILTLFPSADGFSLSKSGSENRPKSYYSMPILLIAFTLCAAYTFISTHRLLNGGLEQFWNDAMTVHLLRNSLNYAKYGFDLGLLIVSSAPMLAVFKAGFFVVTVFEVLSLVILVNRTFRLMWLAVIVPFHVLSLLTMNIFFWENLVLILVLFVFLSEINRESITHLAKK